jgi:hypothetical protein
MNFLNLCSVAIHGGSASIGRNGHGIQWLPMRRFALRKFHSVLPEPFRTRLPTVRAPRSGPLLTEVICKRHSAETNQSLRTVPRPARRAVHRELRASGTGGRRELRSERKRRGPP